MQPCDCCDGTDSIVPVEIQNRPGLSLVQYRIGTYASFLESMLARLNRACVGKKEECDAEQGPFPLRDRLKTRSPHDPSLAFLDAWAAIADVLTFYQERIANEGFLSTAVQPRSLHELSRLVGYRPRPGLSASGLVAFEVEEPETPNGVDAQAALPSGGVLIPKGTAVESTPASGTTEEPQTFETSDDLIAFQAWNNISLRKTRPQRIHPRYVERLYLQGLGLGLIEGDYLYVTVGENKPYFVHRITKLTENAEQEWTLVEFAGAPLSASRLVETLRRAMEAFPGTLRLRDVPLISTAEPALAQEARTKLQTLWQSSEPTHYSIARIDDYFCARLIEAELGDRAMGPDTIKSVAAEMLRWASDLEVRATQPGGAFAEESLLGPYKTKVAGAIEGDYLAQQDIVDRNLNAVTTNRTLFLHHVEKTVHELTGTLDSAVIMSVNPEPIPLGGPGFVPLDPDGRVFLGPLAPRLRFVIIEVVERNVADGFLNAGAIGWTIVSLGPGMLEASHPGPTEADLQNLLRSLEFQATLAGAWQIEVRYQDTPFLLTGAIAGFALLNVFKGAAPPVEWEANRLQIQPLETAVKPFASLPNLAGYASAACSWKISEPLDLPSVPPVSLTLSQLRDVEVELTSAQTGLRIMQVRVEFTDGQFWRTHAQLIGVRPDEPAAFKRSSSGAPLLRALPRRTVALHERAAQLANLLPSNVAIPYLLDVGLPLVEDELTDLVAELAAPEPLSTLRLAAERKDAVVQAMQSMVPPFSTVRARLEELESILDEVDLEEILNLVLLIVQLAPAPPPGEPASNEVEEAVDELRMEIGLSSKLALAAALVEQFEEDLVKASREIKSRFVQYQAAVQNLHDSILTALRNVRVEFLTAVREALDRHAELGTTGGVTLPRTEIERLLSLQSPENPLARPSRRSRRIAQFVEGYLPASAVDPASLAAELKDLVERVNPARPTPLAPHQPSLEDLLKLFPAQALSLPVQADLIAALKGKLDPHQIKQLLARLATTLGVKQRRFFFDLLRNERVNEPHLEPKVFALPTQANVFGWNAPPKDRDVSDVRVETFTSEITQHMPTGPSVLVRVYPIGIGYPPFVDTLVDISSIFVNLVKEKILANIARFLRKRKHRPNRDAGDAPAKLFLDGEYRSIKPGDLIALRKLPYNTLEEPSAVTVPETYRVEDVRIRPRTAYGLRGNTTEVYLDRSWWNPFNNAGKPIIQAFEDVSQTRVFCEARRLPLAEEPFVQPSRDVLVCDTVVDNLEPGQRLAIFGEPEFGAVHPASNTDSELVTIHSVTHQIDPQLFGDRYVTHIRLTEKLRQDRSTGQIMANLVEVTHGKSVRESVGDGRGDKPFLKHKLAELPLSRLSAPTPTGFQNELKVHVNDVEWTESRSLPASEQAQSFVPREDFTQAVTLEFGDGGKSARPPTGLENIKAWYRVGVGIAGNVAERRIDQVSGSPIGVTGVINPVAAEGGADPDGANEIRARAPLAVMAFDRLVSVADYRDFALSYSGIGKATAIRRGRTVYVTIGATHPGPTSTRAKSYRNLVSAMASSGAANQRFRILDRDISYLVIFAEVQIEQRYQWELVEKSIRGKLFDFYSYRHAEFNATLYQADAVAAIQRVCGVRHVRLKVFDRLDDEKLIRGQPGIFTALAVRSQIKLRNTQVSAGMPPQPAELCFMNPQAPGTLVLEPMSHGS